MASSVNKILTLNVPAYLIDELQNDATGWTISAQSTTDDLYTETVTASMNYNNSSLEITDDITISIPEGKTINKIFLSYLDSTDSSLTIIDEEVVNEVFTYGGNYVVTNYLITFTV